MEEWRTDVGLDCSIGVFETVCRGTVVPGIVPSSVTVDKTEEVPGLLLDMSVMLVFHAGT